MSLNSLLSIARTALLARQAQLETTGHNIANSSTEGYTRQRVRTVANTPLRTPLGQIGTGVTISGIERARSVTLDANFRTESGSLGHSQTMYEALSSVEGMMGEPSDTGLAASLDAFWASWSDLAADPSGSATRTMVRQRGAQVAAQMNDLARRLSTTHGQTIASVNSQLDEVNAAAAQIVSLNAQIRAGEGGGRTAADLRDARDLALDKLASIVPIRAIEQPNGNVSVYVGDALLADGASSREMILLATSDGTFSAGFADNSRPVELAGGGVGANLELLNTHLPDLQNQLDTLAQSFAEGVNALHAGGYTAAGATGIDFFAVSGPPASAASTIAVSSAVKTSLDNIAASGGPAPGAPGDGTVAQSIASLQNTALTGLGDLTAGEYYTNMVTGLAATISNAKQLTASQETLVSQVANQRSAVSDVSLDEELVNMIAFQQAYVAATRIVNAANEMMQSVLQMV